MTPIRILIADDHPVVRSGLKAILASQSDFAIVGDVADGATAVTLYAAEQPDQVLMDLRMPGLDGAAAIAQIRQTDPTARILVLTTYDSDADILRALDAGALGYLLKDAPPDDLFRAVRTTASGQSALAPPVAARLIALASAGPEKALSGRELEVLACVAQGLTNKESGQQLHITEATVKSHLVHIFAKLEVADRTAAVTVALERKLIAVGA